jgi:hypothetical protein
MRWNGVCIASGPDAVQPRAPVLAARCGEGGAGELLGIQAVRAALRRVAPDRQRAGQGFGGEFVAEAGLVGPLAHHASAFNTPRRTWSRSID